MYIKFKKGILFTKSINLEIRIFGKWLKITWSKLE